MKVKCFAREKGENREIRPFFRCFGPEMPFSGTKLHFHEVNTWEIPKKVQNWPFLALHDLIWRWYQNREVKKWAGMAKNMCKLL